MHFFKWSLICLVIVLTAGCTGQAVETRPDSELVSPESPTLGMPADPSMYRALAVVSKFGKMTHRHMSYNQYRKSGYRKDSAFNPEIFYDSYELDLNEQNHWITLTFYTAERAITKDPRIEQLMKGFPAKAVDVKMKMPSGETYLLSDSNADGVLEFASSEGAPVKNHSRIDLRFLKRMQNKYHWILGIVKRYYRL